MEKIYLPEDNKSLDDFLQNKKVDYSGELMENVNRIIETVKKDGDKALFDFTEKYDGIKLDKLAVAKEFLTAAEIGDELLESLKTAKNRLADYSKSHINKSWYKGNKNGGFVGEQITPIERVGLYIPGGRAAYPSSVLMTAVPALVAGVKEIVAVSPPGSNGKINPVVARTLKLCGVEEVYSIGGAQAIAALAYGTETINRVDKIVGPGNKYVTMAKKLVFGQVDIDMLAGPSEVLVIADGTAEPAAIAADLLAQAEHDPEARVVLITTEEDIIVKVENQLEKQLEMLQTRETARCSLKDYGLIIKVKDLDEAVEVSNKIAPEHLELIVGEPLKYIDRIKHAGSIFIGRWTPEVAGDYLAGPNHVLPTSGTARFSSPLSVNDFLKSSSLIYFTEEELKSTFTDIERIAESERLPAHASAARIRLESYGDKND
ncbi:MAG: histidinol dehydrogenase [Halanaerobiaceae bacterium]